MIIDTDHSITDSNALNIDSGKTYDDNNNDSTRNNDHVILEIVKC